jgi:hypothetical protein
MSVLIPIIILLASIIAILLWALMFQDRDYRRHSPPEQQQEETEEA